jgi:hypothetical protein
MQTRRFAPTIQPEREGFARPNRAGIVRTIDEVRFERARKRRAGWRRLGNRSHFSLRPDSEQVWRRQRAWDPVDVSGIQDAALDTVRRNPEAAERRAEQVLPLNGRSASRPSLSCPPVRRTMIRESQTGIPQCGISSRKRRSILVYGLFSPIFEGSNRRIGLPLCCVAFTLACA